jgi:hypothetical protein
MFGYAFITSKGYDPGKGKLVKDPYWGDKPSLGACMPNIRRQVQPGDHIFTISGKIPDVKQYVIGGFEVAEKIHATEAYKRFPEQRLHLIEDGQLAGNVIVDARGQQHPLDTHPGASFENRLNNYIVGRNPIVMATPEEIARAREETIYVLRFILGKGGNSPINVIGRCSKLDEFQVLELRDWLLSLKSMPVALRA